MDKRDFILGAGALTWTAATWTAEEAGAPGGSAAMPVLTVAGRMGRSNRGPTDGVYDQLMKRQGVSFERARAFSLPDLLRLPALTLSPTLEYDAKVHTLKGPALVNVLRVAGVDVQGASRVRMRALDGYLVTVTMQQVRERAMILATHIDGMPLSIGGLGPLWGVFDPVRSADLKDKPLAERFGDCPWGLYFIDVVA